MTASKSLKAILVGGAVAGALDIAYAFIAYGPLSYRMSPVQVLQSVAGGWVGHDAATAGGAATALLGLATHFMIATCMAAVFVMAAKRMAVLNRHPVPSGLVYGLILYLVMTYITVPLSAAHRSQHFVGNWHELAARLQESFSAVRPKDHWQLLGTLLTHTAFVGVPIALLTSRRA